jgi:hypothetical protein
MRVWLLLVAALFAPLARAQVTIGNGGSVNLGNGTPATYPWSQITGAPAVPTTSNWPNAGTCSNAAFITGLSNGLGPTCAQVSWAQIANIPANLLTSGGTQATVVATMTSGSNGNSSVGTAPGRKALGNCYTLYNPTTSALVPSTNGGNLYCTSAIQTTAVGVGGPSLGYVAATVSGTGTTAFTNGNGAGGTYSPAAVTSTYGGSSTDSACTSDPYATVSSGVVGLTLPGCAANSSTFFSQTTGTGASTDTLYPTSWVVSSGDQADHLVRETWWRVNSLATLQNLEFDTNYHPSTGDYYGWGWQYNNQAGKLMFQYCPQLCPSWITVKLVDPTGVNATLTSYPITQGHWYHTRIYMDRGSVSTCTTAANTPCFYYRQLYLEDVTAGTPGVLYNIVDATTGLTPAGIPVSYPTWTKNQFTLQHQLDMNTASATTTVDVDSDTLTAYYVSATSSGPTTVSETRGSLGEWDFDGSDTGATPTATGTPTSTSTAYSAPAAMEYNAATEYDTVSVTASTSIYARFYLQANAAAASSIQVFDLYNSTTQLGNLYLNSSNQYLTFYNVATTTSTNCSGGSSFPTGAFHLIELYWTESATTGAFTVKVDGTQTCAVTGVNTGTSQVNSIRFGEVNAPSPVWDVTIDSVGVDTSSWLGAVTFSSSSQPTYQSYMAGVSSDNNNGVSVTGALTASGGVDPGVSTVAALPSASSSAGKMRRVSDSTTISAEGQTCTGGGTATALAFSNGSVWKCF